MIDEVDEPMIVTEGEAYDLTSQFAKDNYVCKNLSELTGVWDRNKTTIALLYDNTQPDITGFDIHTPNRHNDYILGQPIGLVVYPEPFNAWQTEWVVEADVGTEVVDSTHVKPNQTGHVTFNVRSVEMPEVSTMGSFNCIDPDAETLSMDNTVAEIKEELDSMGIAYKGNDNKKTLLEKLQ